MTPKRILGSLIAVVFILMVIFVKKSQKEIKLDLIKYDSAINSAKIEIKSLELESKEKEKKISIHKQSVRARSKSSRDCYYCYCCHTGLRRNNLVNKLVRKHQIICNRDM